MGALHSQYSRSTLPTPLHQLHSTPPFIVHSVRRAPLHKSQRFSSLCPTGPTSKQRPSSAHLTSLTSTRVPLVSCLHPFSSHPSSRVCPRGGLHRRAPSRRASGWRWGGPRPRRGGSCSRLRRRAPCPRGAESRARQSLGVAPGAPRSARMQAAAAGRRETAAGMLAPAGCSAAGSTAREEC